MPNITIELSNTHKKISQGGTYRWDHWQTDGEATRHD
jgi:hypothetical protein